MIQFTFLYKALTNEFSDLTRMFQILNSDPSFSSGLNKFKTSFTTLQLAKFFLMWYIVMGIWISVKTTLHSPSRSICCGKYVMKLFFHIIHTIKFLWFSAQFCFQNFFNFKCSFSEIILAGAKFLFVIYSIYNFSIQIFQRIDRWLSSTRNVINFK